MYNVNSREATATFGYDYILRQCRLRGRIDSGGVGEALWAEGEGEKDQEKSSKQDAGQGAAHG